VSTSKVWYRSGPGRRPTDASRACELFVLHLVRHHVDVLPPPHRTFRTAVVTHRGKHHGRRMRIGGHRAAMPVRPAEVSVANTAPCRGIVGENESDNHGAQGGSRDPPVSLDPPRLPPMDDPPHPTGSTTSGISGRRNTAWSDYLRAIATHRTSTIRCRRRIRRPPHKARQPQAAFRPISSKPISTCHPRLRYPEPAASTLAAGTGFRDVSTSRRPDRRT
jgi:hypothetical protein